ncbi:MAG TPA: hypothetical protein VJ201_01965 [Candidatus Babeliales bacterium]|nr:hypothetical protein [Candidatus Babeliales bacterium]
MKRKVLLLATTVLLNIIHVLCDEKPVYKIVSNERRSSEPYITGDTFRQLSHFVFDESAADFDPAKITKPSIIFVKNDHFFPKVYKHDHLKKFFQEYHPLISHKYILITHNGDRSAPGEFLSYLDDPKIIHWFGQNTSIKNHPKFTPIPIGIANKYWAHGDPDIFDNAIRKAVYAQKKFLLYSNFEPSNMFAKRQPVIDYFSDKRFCYKAARKKINLYLAELAESKFVLCPEGCGLDCHRMWETLLMGSIPVMQRSTLSPLFEGLPVVIVDTWSDVTKDFLEKKWQEFCSQDIRKEYRLEKIYVSYWKNLILNTLKKNS